MGQRLFEPPSVKGWDGHRKWLNAATMLVRLNTAVHATRPAADDQPGFHPAVLLDRYDLEAPARIVRFALNLALDGRAPPELEARAARITGPPATVLARTLRLAIGSPEYQMG
jgi:hypothetical protein